jgi:hypothetical protein
MFCATHTEAQQQQSYTSTARQLPCTAYTLLKYPSRPQVQLSQRTVSGKATLQRGNILYTNHTLKFS